ncbi:MAG: hypothetical protein AAFY76_00545 [Cyanobacteria bacterium J06649_11]
MSKSLFLLLAGSIAIASLAIAFYFLKQTSESHVDKAVAETRVEFYSLEEAIAWFKDNSLGNKHTACLLREEDSIVSKPQHYIKLQHCFLDESRNPLLGSNYPVLTVRTINIDDDLRAAFGDRKMIIFD